MSILTVSKIRELEKNAVLSHKTTYRELMYTAGTLAGKSISDKYDIKNKKVAVVCGVGNNGGDGFVIADFLSKKGALVKVFTPFGIPKTEDALFYCNKLQLKVCEDFSIDNFDIIIDSIFGIGLNREVDTYTLGIFDKINNQKAIKISVDIPSGIEADTGKVLGGGVFADYTVTFTALKPCFVLPCGSDYCGKVEVIDLGLGDYLPDYEIIKEPEFKKRMHNSHKGTYGTAVLFCGSYGMAGAAMLSAKAALRSGLGIAKCVLPKSIYNAFTSYLPEAVCRPTEDTQDGKLKFDSVDFVEALSGADAVLCGCGIGNCEDTKRITEYLILNSEVPVIIDADGINSVADSIEILKKAKVPIILTPHPGEMARLCKTDVKEIENNRISYAEKFAAEFNCIVVLKGANTIVAEPNGSLSFNVLGNPGMATGGSGDVLAGIVVSLLAQGFTPQDAAKGAVYLHSSAADKAVLKRSCHSLLPADIIEEL